MEIDSWLEKYAETFDDGFPMYQLGRGLTNEEIIEIIKRCLREEKDAYELGLVTDDEDTFY